MLGKSVNTPQTGRDKIQNVLTELNISQFGNNFVDSGEEWKRQFKGEVRGLRQKQ